MNIASGSGDAHLDGIKVAYPDRKPLPESEDAIDILVDSEELFDCYVR